MYSSHEAPQQEDSMPMQEGASDRRTVTVIRNDCGEKMMRDAARKACIALDCSDENDPDRKQDMATSLKANFDRDYEGTWNVVVGSDFGASITHELSRIIFFAIESEFSTERQSIYILLFQQTESSVAAADDESGSVAPNYQQAPSGPRGSAPPPSSSSEGPPMQRPGMPPQMQRGPPQERSSDRPPDGIHSEF